MFEDIEEIPFNFCGVIADRYVLSAPVDDPIEKTYMHFHVHDKQAKDAKDEKDKIKDKSRPVKILNKYCFFR